MANLFEFSYGSLNATYDGAGSFTTAINPVLSSGSVSRVQVPQGVANFIAGSWGLGGDFTIAMTISNITATSAKGVGSFINTDVDGDTITGNLAGTWAPLPPPPAPQATSNIFAGLLSNVAYNDNGALDDSFDGHLNSISMSYIQPEPWRGTIIELTTTGTWFGEGAFTTNQGSVDASVVPVPAAVLLGFFGLSAAGLKLRRFA
jgi:hypothetical protein